MAWGFQLVRPSKRISVNKGDMVKRGQTIGNTGATGMAGATTSISAS